jgi:hypothetical protein
VTVTWLDPVELGDFQPHGSRRPSARLVGVAGGAQPGDGEEAGGSWAPPLTVVPDRRLVVVPDGRRPRSNPRRVSPQVRRRRTLLAVLGLLLIALALPLSGTGGYSHPTGSALAGNRGPFVYTVQPGDSLFSIAERLQPKADPRPLVAKLASQTGSESVTPGERIVLP